MKSAEGKNTEMLSELQIACLLVLRVFLTSGLFVYLNCIGDFSSDF